MTTVGLVGGLGPESTIDYYGRILAAWQREDPSTAPSIVIDSLDVQRALRLVATDRPALAEYQLASVRRLADAGGGLLEGDFREATRQAVAALVVRLRDRYAADGVTLRGTELPPLLGVPVIAGLSATEPSSTRLAAHPQRGT